MMRSVGKPTWNTSSFLLYAGGLTVLGAAIGALAYLSSQYGSGAYVLWALLVLVVLYAIAHVFKRQGRWIAAGIFAFASVIAWAAFLAALWHWFGWLNGTHSAFAGFSVARLSLALLVLVAARDDRRRFEFPFIAAISTVVGWYFVTDLISNGGDWTAVVTLVIGLVYLVTGTASDSPSAFWFHLVGGVLIGGSLLHWWHSSDTDWALISVVALVYVWIAYGTKRSSWAVLATIGLFLAGAHFTADWTTVNLSFSTSSVTSFRGWVPSAVFAFIGFLLVALGLGRRRAARL